jgi:predicted dehydrogenase
MLLIGYGYWGKILHRIFKDEILAICDNNFIELPNYITFNSIDETIKKYKGSKIAIIATPVSTHFEIAKILIENHFDIWIEKPVTDTIEKIDNLIELSEKNKTVIFVNHIYCYDDNIIRIKQINLKDPVNYRSIRLAPGPIRYDTTSIIDLGIHDLSIINFLYPEAELISKDINIIHKDHVLVNFVYNNNFKATVECSWSFPIKKRLIITKYRDNTVVHDSAEKNILRIFDSNLKEINTFETKNETLQNAKKHFLMCIKNRQIPKTNLYNAKKIMEWIYDS